MEYKVTENSDSYLYINQLLYQQLDNFSYLNNFIKSKNIIPSVVFLPQTLKLISENNNINLVSDCLNFLDVIKFYSGLIYSEEEYYINLIKNIIISNRTVLQTDNVLNKDIIDDFLFSSKEDVNDFLENNKIFLAIYICSLLNFIFFSF